MITSFFEFDNESMGGCESFRFIPVNNVESLSSPVNCIITSDPVPKTGKSILTGLALMDSLSFKEEQDEANAGPYYKTVIEGFVPKLTPYYLALFNEMKQQRHIVICKDNNGYERVAGNTSIGMYFTFSQDTKDTPAKSNGYSFKFYNSFTEPAPFLEIPVS